MRKVLISGATGYIGKKFISMYKDLLEITAIVRTKKKLNEFEGYIEIITIDELKEEDIDFSDYYYINLAFPRKSDLDLLLDSFDFTLSIISHTAKHGLKKVINISSQSVYDINRTRSAYEYEPVKVFSLYGMAKIYVEHQIEFLSNIYGFDFIHLRIASVIGENFEQRFVNKFIKSLLKGDRVCATEKGERFSFINVVDVCRAIYELVSNDEIIWNEIYNVGGPDEYTISQVLTYIQRELSTRGRICEISIDNSEVEVKKTNKVSSNKFINASSWIPEYNIEKSIKTIVDSLI